MTLGPMVYQLNDTTNMQSRALMKPETADPDARLEYAVKTGQGGFVDNAGITLEEWRKKISETWDVFKWE